MSSVDKHPKTGNYRIRFRYNGSQQCVLLPKCTQKQATVISDMIDRLLVCKKFGTNDNVVSSWLSSLSGPILDKLIRIGLVEDTSHWDLETLYAEFIKSKPGVVQSTLDAWGQAYRNLTDFFGNRDITIITKEEAQEFKAWLPEQPKQPRKPRTTRPKNSPVVRAKAVIGRSGVKGKLSPTTVEKRTAFVKQWFEFAVKKGKLSQSPFQDIVVHRLTNPERQYFISREDSRKILEACPNTKWRCIFALARFIGIRMPSELWTLKWEDIKWSDPTKQGAEAIGNILIHDQKRSRHTGLDKRISPLWTEAESELLKLYSEAEEGEEYVFPGMKPNSSLRATFERIVFRAGVELYPKIFQNLRSSLETEYHRAGIDPLVYTRWLGNSPAIAIKHYVQYTTEDRNQGVATFVTKCGNFCDKVWKPEEDTKNSKKVSTKVSTQEIEKARKS